VKGAGFSNPPSPLREMPELLDFASDSGVLLFRAF